LDSPVTVAVGLHHGHQVRAGLVLAQFGDQESSVVGDGVGIDDGFGPDLT